MTMPNAWIGDESYPTVEASLVMKSKDRQSDRGFTASRNRITFQFWPFIEGSAEGGWGILALLFLGGGGLVVNYLCYAH